MNNVMNNSSFKKITKEELFKKLNEKLQGMCCLTQFYIGKTNDIQRRSQEHEQQDTLYNTVELAKGNPNAIDCAEKYLISQFKSYNSFCQNSKIGGGSPNADILYISYNCDMSKAKSTEELNDDDINWPTVFIL